MVWDESRCVSDVGVVRDEMWVWSGNIMKTGKVLRMV